MNYLIEEQYKKLKLFYVKNIVSIAAKRATVKHKRNFILADSFTVALKNYLEAINCSEFYEEALEYVEELWGKDNVSKREVGKVINSVLTYCSDLYFKYGQEVTESRYPEAILTMNVLGELLEFLVPDSKKLFVDFFCLENVFQEVGLTKTKQAELVTTIIELNNERFKKGDYDPFIPSERALLDYKFKYLKPDRLKFMLKSCGINSFLQEKIKSDNKRRRELRKAISAAPFDPSFMGTKWALIVANLHNTDFGEKEEEALKNCFDYLGIYNLGIMVINRKNKEMEKQKEALKKELLSKNTVPKEKVEPKVMLPKKEINKISHELDMVYDFDNNVLKRSLTLSEIIEFLAKLIYINASPKTIKEFLHYTESDIKKNSIRASFEFQDKWTFLSENPEVQRYLTEINNVLKESTPFLLDNEEYEELKRELEFNIKNLWEIIGTDYTYEFQKAEEINKCRKLGGKKNE